MFNKFKPYLIVLISLISLFFIIIFSTDSELIILDPKGPVGAVQKDLIMLSIYYMIAIMVVVLGFFTIILFKYRSSKKNSDYKPDMHGSTFLEIIWTLIPVLIVIALSIPNTKALYELKNAPEATSHKDPIVIHATAVDWKWIFSYPEEGIETVNYVNVPEDHPILFKVTAADSMASFWVPQIGGQIYGMPGMVNDLYLQADEPGTYDGRNSNFTGEGMTHQTFDFVAMKQDKYEDWVEDAQDEPKLTEDTYEKLMLPETVDKMTFSSTHLAFVDHGKNSEYAMAIRQKYGLDTTVDGADKDAQSVHGNMDMDGHEGMDHDDKKKEDDHEDEGSHEH
ncbi:cytochrome aa3 quinol oxidase subunit II [Rossellomorea vietnamensis]|uniref:Cytochrome aa3 quinol oxidase subunit II n=2 Tax=Rossellomorea vietnamensis TaxID=218284 RepID=A0ACD4C5E9_9BACI|nr:cytochrome aa3 quinol oxidase subunit II [Rossellomorea vietnamensis]QHE63071.1 cytochrome aa3 quinol oxidase subunit II [Rossellomorea vietnamensis]UXH43556.1 cytochrome aa3 quinol oxidase subunit II [Rossellomorea vietnamensis]WQI94907.1 cytochrome aa3 quinol oxidase subunit II [Rossellomorea vietnamensis]